MEMKDIDKHLDASGVVKLIEMKKAEAKRNIKPLLTSAGTAKPGKALSVHGLAQAIDAAETVLHWIDLYLQSIGEGGKEDGKEELGRGETHCTEGK